jgi:hypothetical protein
MAFVLGSTNRIRPGQQWDIEIRKAVRASHTILICLSQRSVSKSGYVQKEIRFALDVADEKPDDVIFLIPVCLDDCAVPDRLQRFQWVNLHTDDGYDRLIASLTIVGEASGRQQHRPAIACWALSAGSRDPGSSEDHQAGDAVAVAQAAPAR